MKNLHRSAPSRPKPEPKKKPIDHVTMEQQRERERAREMELLTSPRERKGKKGAASSREQEGSFRREQGITSLPAIVYQQAHVRILRAVSVSSKRERERKRKREREGEGDINQSCWRRRSCITNYDNKVRNHSSKNNADVLWKI